LNVTKSKKKKGKIENQEIKKGKHSHKKQIQHGVKTPVITCVHRAKDKDWEMGWDMDGFCRPQDFRGGYG